MFSAPTSQEKFPHWITASHDTGTVDDLFGNPMGDVEWDRFRSANNSDIDSSLRVNLKMGKIVFFFNDLRAMIIESLNVLKPYPED